MSDLDRENLEKLCKLCRIEATEEELTQFAKELPKVLDYVERLGEVDTDSVPACCQAVSGLPTLFRDDETGELLDRREFLNNSPSHTAGMVRVPPVIKQGTSA